MLTKLSDAATEELTFQTTPISNLIRVGSGNTIFMNILGWYREHGLTTNDSLRKRIAKLSELLGSPPNFYRQYEFRTAAWGFQWEVSEYAPHNEFIVYYSNRGFDVEVHPKFRKDMLESLLLAISDVLGLRPIRSTV